MTGEGKYDPEFERLCYEYRHLFTGRSFGVGASWRMPDWFVNDKSENAAHHYEVPFVIPNLEQLNRMLAERIQLYKRKAQPDDILLVFTPELPGWLLQVQLGKDTYYGRGSSPHTAYLQCIHKMSLHVPTELHIDKHPYSLQAHGKEEDRSDPDKQQQPFSQEYIAICRKHRSFFRSRKIMRGEWYGHIRTGELKRYGQEPVEFCASERFYIPELDELFAFLSNQIMLTQESVKPAEMVILNYKPVSGWEVMVRLDNGIALSSCAGKSPHEVLFTVLFGMAAFDVKLRKSKSPGISVNPQPLREFAWRMELEGDPGLCDDPSDSKPALDQVATQEEQSPTKYRLLLAKLVLALRKFLRL